MNDTKLQGVERFPDGIEPEDVDAAVWRYMKLERFLQLLRTSRLYFRRADLFPDESEGLPPREYERFLCVRSGTRQRALDPYDIRDLQERESMVGFLAQARQACYISCWHLFAEERVGMWTKYAPGDGIAICTRYGRLKSVLVGMNDRAFLGCVRYGTAHLTGWNALTFISTKREEYAAEQEIRAMLWILDGRLSTNRHIDENGVAHRRELVPPPPCVSEGLQRKIDVQQLIERIVVSPFSDRNTTERVRTLVAACGLALPVEKSELARYRRFLP